MNPFLVFDFFQTFICYRECLNLKRYINKNVQKNFLMGFKISPTCPKFNTHKKFVVHFFIPMLLLPLTPPLIYLKLKKIKGPKMDSLFHFFTFHFFPFTSHFKHGKKRSIAGTAQHSTPISTKEILF